MTWLLRFVPSGTSSYSLRSLGHLRMNTYRKRVTSPTRTGSSRPSTWGSASTDTASGPWRPNDGAAYGVPWRPGGVRRDLHLILRCPGSRGQRPKPPGRRRRPSRSVLRPVLLKTVGVAIEAWPAVPAFVRITGDRLRVGCEFRCCLLKIRIKT